ncbi:MAG: sigma-70 family RNA polymerase sigma factor [Lachnospiraceae bacterium]|uniref:RNA polymerase sigma factor n=1 Tax=Clostridioides difficile TaxID=1496 RepID=UPI00202E2F67|nr:sigma factor-like helix-turn-helix DNA-binding protein [Clostridioides difficile]MCI9083199.1 sigma-70 family RNA polymerase sigma factor [Lachnospiraceae bacterium]MCM0747096.1 sigma-70 family RNA polymerase sigma factor [Clostridioides difficile]
MLEKHPNRKKDKYNPYTLTITEGRYYLSFKDGRGKQQNIEIDEVLYQTFDRFELEDISHLNRVSRHIEHSELTEETLNDRTFHKAKQIEDIVSESIEYEQLHRAVSKLPKVQRRRLKLYFFGEMSYEQIAKLEGCTKRAVKFSVDIAVEKLKKNFKKF